MGKKELTEIELQQLKNIIKNIGSKSAMADAMVISRPTLYRILKTKRGNYNSLYNLRKFLTDYKKVTNYGLKPDVGIVKEYIKETMNVFTDIEKLEEVEKFALWIMSNNAAKLNSAKQ